MSVTLGFLGAGTGAGVGTVAAELVDGLSTGFRESVGTEPNTGGPFLSESVGGFAGEADKMAAASDLAGKSASEPKAIELEEGLTL